MPNYNISRKKITGENFFNFGVGSYFKTQKSISIKERIDKFDFAKINLTPLKSVAYSAGNVFESSRGYKNKTKSSTYSKLIESWYLLGKH